MRISVPIDGNKISGHFGGSDSFYIAEVTDDGAIVNEFIQKPPEHVAGAYPLCLKNQNVDILLVKNIGSRAIEFLNDYGVKVITGIPGEKPKNAVVEYVKGNIKSSMEFCKGSGNCAEH